jgi:hypothetical protein
VVALGLLIAASGSAAIGSSTRKSASRSHKLVVGTFRMIHAALVAALAARL